MQFVLEGFSAIVGREERIAMIPTYGAQRAAFAKVKASKELENSNENATITV